jgi:hypothetical protein
MLKYKGFVNKGFLIEPLLGEVGFIIPLRPFWLEEIMEEGNIEGHPGTNFQ